MEFNIQFTYEQVVDIISQMPDQEREKLIREVINVPNFFDHSSIDRVMNPYHSKFEETYKALA